MSNIEVTFIDKMGSDMSVVNAARVSFSKTSEYEKLEDGTPVMKASDEKLIKYLAEHNHWTPFGHAQLSLHIKVPIFVARQLAKHQVGGVVNEVSRRYVDSDPEFFFPDHWRAKHENKKQGSHDDVFVDEIYHINPTLDVEPYSTTGYVQELCNKSLALYKHLLASGICPEQARMVLPQNMMTEWIWSGSLFFFARVCGLRCKPDAQKETQAVGNGIAAILEKEFPVSWKYLKK